MKHALILILSLASINFVLGSVARAEGPCKKAREKVRKACESAGFYEGGHKVGKGLHKDCMRKIMQGEQVTGVSLSGDTDVAACQKKRAERADKHRDKLRDEDRQAEDSVSDSPEE